jgi:hypothetical protein
MRKVKVLLMSLACAGALAISAAALTLNPPRNTNQNDACCDKADCCKAGDKDMSCCKAKKNGKNNHACCKDNNGASCCCKGDSCPMPNKKTGNTNSN